MLFVLAMDADSHRQRIINWIDGTGKLSTAFDFTTKGILQVFFKYLLTEIIFYLLCQVRSCISINSWRNLSPDMW